MSAIKRFLSPPAKVIIFPRDCCKFRILCFTRDSGVHVDIFTSHLPTPESFRNFGIFADSAYFTESRNSCVVVSMTTRFM